MRDFAKPFEGMPSEKPPPEGELPFGPRNLSMFRLGWERVVLLDSNLGYRFGAKGAESEARTLHLNWRVAARLLAVDASGRVKRQAGEIQRRLGDVKDMDLLEFAFPANRRGLYRFDLFFRDLRGRRLGAYREYFRVVPRSVELDLVLDAAAVHPGESVRARVRNLGTVDAIVPSRYLVSGFAGGSWVPIGEAIAPGFALSEGPWWVAGGESSWCAEYTLPPGAAPGTYRVSTSAQVFGTRQRRSLAASFEVAPY
ncbi:MAG TPA: hypothetical protein VF729_08785 [Solirubrobacterales bacterium]